MRGYQYPANHPYATPPPECVVDEALDIVRDEVRDILARMAEEGEPPDDLHGIADEAFTNVRSTHIDDDYELEEVVRLDDAIWIVETEVKPRH